MIMIMIMIMIHYDDDYDKQGPDLYAFIGFIGPKDINYMCYILVIKY